MFERGKIVLNILKLICIFFLIAIVGLSTPAFSQNWTALPPYNVLWPLWSPELSPIDPVIGIPTPLISSLTSQTELPIPPDLQQPGLVWNPNLDCPWLLFNSKKGLLFYDHQQGIRMWPPGDLLDPVTGVPVPITLREDWAIFSPTPTNWLSTYIPMAIAAYNVYTGKTLPEEEEKIIYVRLRAGEYKIKSAPRESIYSTQDEVIVEIKDFLPNNSPGDPLLPYQIYNYALPPEAVAESLRIEIIRIAEREIQGSYRIAPVPPHIFDQGISEEEARRLEFLEWGIDKKDIVEGHNILVYSKDAFYPGEYCQVKPGGQLRKWKVATIVYYPIRYNPVKSKLVLAEEIDLKISFDIDYTYLTKIKTIKLLQDDTFDARAQKLLLNYKRAKEWYLQPLRSGLLKRYKPTTKNETLKEDEGIKDPNYAIVTTEEIYTNSEWLDDFCFHKQDLGFSVLVVTEHHTHTVDGPPDGYFFVDAAGGYEDVVGDEPNQRPEKIRQWLMDNYLTLGIEYVLLVGNPDPDNTEATDLVGDLPMLLCQTSLTYGYPTDLYFSDLSGDWNLDDDSYVGESYLAGGYSTLPAGVTGGLFSVRWEGFIEVSGAADPISVSLYGYTEGRTEIWVDKDNDGYTGADVVIAYDPIEHIPPEYHSVWLTNLANGTYPIKIEYRHSTGDAYCSFRIRNYVDGVDTKFKHGAAFENGLDGDYFNNDNFIAPPDVPDVYSSLNKFEAIFIPGGDRGPGGVDFYPEVIVGRIPNYDEDEDGYPDYAALDAILAKIIQYENADIQEETWRRQVLISTPYMYSLDGIPGYETADFKGGEYLMCNIAPPPFWQWTRIHDEDYGDQLCYKSGEVIIGCNDDNMVDAWNNGGRGVVMWRTHGSQTGSSHVFYQDRCADLDDSKPSVVIQTTCLNGKPEVGTGTVKTYPLGYSLLKHGAIATISASQPSSGGLFNPGSINIASKNNPYLCYFLSKGVLNNIDVGYVLAHVREHDATLGLYWGNILMYNLYGDPSLSLFGADVKSNNDIVFLLDGSGSMLSEGKWDAAMDAAVLYYQLMEVLRDPVFEDRYNTVIFRWPCSGDTDSTTTVPPSTGLKDISVPLTIGILNDYTPEGGYCTPIGEGLLMAIDQFDLDTEESFYSNKNIILLSDGKHNRGVDPMDVTIPEEIRVMAVGLGEDYIEPDTISDIAESSGGDYRITPSPREMEDFFIQILCNTSWKLQDVTITGNIAPIDESKAVFIVVWDDPTASLGFDLDPPGDGPDITDGTLDAYFPMSCSYHAPAPGETHAFYVCEHIPGSLLGEWQFVNINDGGIPVPLADVLLKVIEDPRIIADFDIEDIDHYTGQPIVLNARITENMEPKLGLNNVYAELSRSPAMSIGTLMAENAQTLSYIPTYYHPGYQVRADRTSRSNYILNLMEALNIKSLSKVGGPRIYLRDDGVGDDKSPNDGIYTGRFNDTQYEGSYTFKFRASGQSTHGVTFDRTETLSEFVKFGVSPVNTEVAVVSTIADPQGYVRATIKVTPRNEFGSYLGPFRGEIIQPWSSFGSFESGYHDSKDGSYSFTLKYPIMDTVVPSTLLPMISVDIGGVLVKDRNSLYEAWRVNVINLTAQYPVQRSREIKVRNTEGKPVSMNLRFQVPQEELEDPFTKKGQIFAYMDQLLYNRWDKGGRQMKDMILVGSRKFSILRPESAALKNILLERGDMGNISLEFGLYNQPTQQATYNFILIQEMTKETGVTTQVGGVRFEVHISPDPGQICSARECWIPLPPYNVLWPLWSPTLSPVDPITGIPTPLVTTITKDTVLPVKYAIIWDPDRNSPWVIYNGRTEYGEGLLYFDSLYGLREWPPINLLDPVIGTPVPLALRIGWSTLTPTPQEWLSSNMALPDAVYDAYKLDLEVFAEDFGRTDCRIGPPCEGDFDNDGDVDGADLVIFALGFRAHQ